MCAHARPRRARRADACRPAAQDFPPYVSTPFYLRTGGLLSRDSPVEQGRSAYQYDPANPQPTLGGHLLSSICGQYDQRVLESRADVLVFSTPTVRAPRGPVPCPG
jgi:predicted acyl esterase